MAENGEAQNGAEEPQSPTLMKKVSGMFGRSASANSDTPPVSPSSPKRRTTMTAKVSMKTDANTGQAVLQVEDSANVTESLPFNAVVTAICAVNVLVCGLEADFSCWGRDSPVCKVEDRFMWFILDAMFTAFFAIEMLCRIVFLGPALYFRGDDGGIGIHIPNCLDFLVVFLRVLDTFVFQNVGVEAPIIKIICCFRILQLFRLFQSDAAKKVKAIRELWLILAGLRDLAKTVFWVALLLVLIFWVVGVMMTVVLGHNDQYYDYSNAEWSRGDYFGNPFNSMYSMFQMMTFAKGLSTLIRPAAIDGGDTGLLIIIVPFLCLTTVGLLNIIVGVVVDSTLASAAVSAERDGKEMSKVHAKVMESLRTVFEEADTDGGGTLDRQELRKAMKKPAVRDRMKVLDIPVRDLGALFDLLDEEGVGEISTDRFFRGCARLKGHALASDMHRMSVDMGRYIQWSTSLVEQTQSTNLKLDHLTSEMEALDRDIIRGEADVCDPVLCARRTRMAKKAEEHIPRGAFSNKEMEQELGIQGRSGSKGHDDLAKKGAGERRVSLVRRSLSSNMQDLGFTPNWEEPPPPPPLPDSFG